MHKSLLPAAVALLSGASAAVVAVATTGSAPIAFERIESSVPVAVVIPTGTSSLYAYEVTESTTHTTSTSTVWNYTTVWPTGSTTASTQTPMVIAYEKPTAVEADSTFFNLHTITVTVIAQPIVTNYINYASWDIQAQNLKHDTADTKRDVVHERDVYMIPSFITHLTTSVLPASTVFVHVTGSTPQPSTVTSFTTLQANVATPAAIPGVTTTSVTTVITVYASNTASNSTNTNGSTSSTESWLNISTFSYTSSANLTSWTTQPFVPGSAANATISATTYSHTLPTATHTTSSPTAGVLPGFTGASTITLHHGGAKNGAGEGSASVTIIVLVAMVVGIALA